MDNLQGKDKTTVLTAMNLEEKPPQIIFKDQEIPPRLGTLCDFAIDELVLPLLFGQKETPRSKRMDRYRIQVRSSITFDMLVTFTLPIMNAERCFFHYSNGYVVTGSNDSPLR